MSGSLMVYWNSVIADNAHAQADQPMSKGHSDREEAIFHERLERLRSKKFVNFSKPSEHRLQQPGT